MAQIDCMAFGAHPDDAELFCSGLLLKLNLQGFSTAVVDLTCGELSSNGTPEEREKETAAATKLLTLKFRKNMRIPDGNIENNITNRISIIKLLRELRPKICLVPYWQDRHPDHRATSILLDEAVFQSGLSKMIPEMQAYRPKSVLYYMLHQSFTPSLIIDITDLMEKKLEVIKAYKSQFVRSANQGTQTYINRPEFLESIVTRARYFGHQVGCKYGEPYLYKGPLLIDNIMQIFA